MKKLNIKLKVQSKNFIGLAFLAITLLMGACLEEDTVSSKVTPSILEKVSPFTPRFGHQVVVLNDEMYSIAGRDNDSNKNDIWKSSDGNNWLLLSQ